MFEAVCVYFLNGMGEMFSVRGVEYLPRPLSGAAKSEYGGPEVSQKLVSKGLNKPPDYSTRESILLSNNQDIVESSQCVHCSSNCSNKARLRISAIHLRANVCCRNFIPNIW